MADLLKKRPRAGLSSRFAGPKAEAGKVISTNVTKETKPIVALVTNARNTPTPNVVEKTTTNVSHDETIPVSPKSTKRIPSAIIRPSEKPKSSNVITSATTATTATTAAVTTGGTFRTKEHLNQDPQGIKLAADMEENLGDAANKLSLAHLLSRSHIQKSLARHRKRLLESNNTIPTGDLLQPGSQPTPSSNKRPRRMPTTNDEPQESGPRVEIVNGKMTIVQSSLVVNEANSSIVDGEYEEIEEGIHATSRYSSFVSRRSTKPWGNEETKNFYSALRQCGLNYSLMQTFLPNRTRQELKNKFMREENQHPELIRQAIELLSPLDIAPFSAQLGDVTIIKNETKTTEEHTDSQPDVVEVAAEQLPIIEEIIPEVAEDEPVVEIKPIIEKTPKTAPVTRRSSTAIVAPGNKSILPTKRPSKRLQLA